MFPFIKLKLSILNSSFIEGHAHVHLTCLVFVLMHAITHSFIPSFPSTLIMDYLRRIPDNHLRSGMCSFSCLFSIQEGGVTWIQIM